MRRNFNQKKGGQVVISAAILFLIFSSAVSLGVATPAAKQIVRSKNFVDSEKSLFVAQAVTEDAVYRLKNNIRLPSTISMTLDGVTATATTSPVTGGKDVISSANNSSFVRKIKARVVEGGDVSFGYGLQAGAGGIELSNSSVIAGNVYSNGPVRGANSNIIRGTVVSAGPAGLIEGVHSTSSAYARTIRNSDIDGDAYYQNISGSTVDGALHPASPDQATTSMPITDAMIASWESAAAAGGTHTSPCPYRVVGPETLGPRKIACNLYLDKTDDLTLRGPVWVVGDISIDGSAKIRVDPSLGNKSVALIAHDTEDLDDHGTITIATTAKVYGNGNPNSFVLLLSQNNGAELNTWKPAIEARNSVSGDMILYALHGLVSIANTVSVKEISAYKIKVLNSAEVNYKSGLANLLFGGSSAQTFKLDWRKEI